MSTAIRKRAVLVGLVSAITAIGAAIGPAANAAPATAAAQAVAPAVNAGFANVPAVPPDFSVPVAEAFTTSGQGARVRRFGRGMYELDFNGIGVPGTSTGTVLPGVSHAHAFGDGACLPQGDPVSNGTGGVRVVYHCYDVSGPADREATVTYTRGGTVQGLLNTVRLDASEAGKPIGSVVRPKVQESSVGGTITVTHEAAGIYVFHLPRLAVSRPSAVDVTAGSPQPRYCRIISRTLGSDATTVDVKVGCVRLNDTSNDDTELNLSYAEDVSPLGAPGTGHAYVSLRPPPTPGPHPLPASDVRNEILGSSGSITFLRGGVGEYELRLQNQHRQKGFAGPAVIPIVHPSARCNITGDFHVSGTDFQTVLVRCTDNVGSVMDSPFQLIYTANL